MHSDRTQLLLSCEHGGREIPPEYAYLFSAAEQELASHRGYDIGGYELARTLSERLDVPLRAAQVSRLLVDLNRRPGSPTLYSEFTRALPAKQKRDLLRRYYLPYRESFEGRILEAIGRNKQVVHLAVHSFTPCLRGEIRNADIGLLYEPKRPLEKVFCLAWKERLQTLAPDLRVRRNYPYRGNSDAFVTFLRRRYAPEQYLGLELEVNQSIAQGPFDAWRRVQEILAESLSDALSFQAELLHNPPATPELR